jgi:hypothetical protein
MMYKNYCNVLIFVRTRCTSYCQRRILKVNKSMKIVIKIIRNGYLDDQWTNHSILYIKYILNNATIYAIM